MPAAPLPSCYHFLRFPKQIVCPIKLYVNCVTIRINCVYFQMTWSFWLPCLKITKSSFKRGKRKWKTTTESKGKGSSSLMPDLGEWSSPPHPPPPQPGNKYLAALQCPALQWIQRSPEHPGAGASLVAQMVKNPPAIAGDAGSIPRPGRSPGEGNGIPLQYSCQGNPMDRGAWWATVHGLQKSRT